ncbi:MULTISPECIES: DUF3566 domain-containing protein [Gordonia]|uniref:DUF3566 domain-containing protein n=2 Tax=Gordonia TaxID=2053 RepID=L7LMV5_9ACTN|nr:MULTISPECIES: DUF3566 domain-containing protein [Gordonia]KJR09653.1 hypothetical protein UG54_03875 [Gordonia sihwensis]MBY4568498.1 hypothetical protein [Gordonia sihwensis]WFN92838.1 DUF3566 domain-containing protein [Gordonia sihwensis]GAC61373.1 hypothetical protein GSI01S_16_00990 [Gordonia sihwensis NBRC 108236]
MSTPNQPDDKNVERGVVPPPWKRAETSAATGLTAGEMAKAAGTVGDDRPGGPPPRGVVSGASPRTESKPPVPSSPPSGPMPAVKAQQGPTPQPGKPGPAGPPAGAQPGANQPGAKPQAPAAPAAAGAAKPAPFVESETRNIPREDLAPKDELPDLDSIHHTEQAKEQAIARAASQTIPARAVGTPLRAAVQIRRVDPWSVFKVTGVLSVAGFFIWMIAVAILYGVLGGMGIWDQINSSFGTLVSADGSTSGQDLISGGQVFMFSALFGVVAAILLTALATISAYIYNVCADMVGGVEVTLADLD